MSLAAPGVELAPLRWWHLAELAELERAVFDVDPWTPEMFWSELAQGASRHYLVALSGGRVVGYAGLAVTDDEAYIQTVGVHPGHRGHGLGAQLMVALLREARRRGARSCGLEVRTENRAARALYTRLGFVDVALRRNYYQPSGGDAYVMRARPIDTAGYGAQLDAAAAALAEKDSAALAEKDSAALAEKNRAALAEKDATAALAEKDRAARAEWRTAAEGAP
ncbi:ribosomal protein S18-alanine N-acetyltransferase [Frankia sp. CNm7]|uniref:Ribosomal protein S18-alanine N-acetyltransferase n=1 Tax=Frankia nepalensis TaxID=1836974 RepID=A0A937RIT6_9ACTN|nr:ribosomal protein S18-alanine N-acetyltransferase [Frankia nepalensis]MBL7501596.1 ribosomal protein S18-alanine N-acetyltransferase [Frankia nepalensis]MBL7515797.1 ribosomal protein S18-alanine N-acetyltransferase [Frankia nepalensis]MBL7519302.1 ribosomal protein S18-alanine N-acetyltransferase [Frankia nepalensis]MBL7626756.1 ribosomal protein S18-alanine N-acetyltransferase [Frankia nepalensis]